MSDIEDFRPHTHLEHHELEMLAFHWDGTNAQALAVTQEIVREMKMRDAEVVAAHARASTRSGGSVEFTMTIRRRSDGREFSLLLRPQEWLVISLHEHRVFFVESMDDDQGQHLFRRVRPVVTLRPKVGAIEGPGGA